jgi:hypothetical protein
MALTVLVARIARIFRSLIGCEITFETAESLMTADDEARGEWNSSDLTALQIGKTPPIYIISASGNSYGFPVFCGGVFTGLAVTTNWENASPSKLIQLGDLIASTLENGVHQEEQRERLLVIEERLNLLREDQNPSSNVIPLRPSHAGRSLHVTEIKVALQGKPSPLTSTPILIETTPDFQLDRVALEIHQISQRWAFVNILDLPADILDSRESFEQLGGVTLFIRDIAKLNVNQQLRLAEYLAGDTSPDKPQIIAGINGSHADRAYTNVLSHLVDLFCVASSEKSDKTPKQIALELVEASLRHILAQMPESHQVGEHIIPFHPQYFEPDQPTMH